MFLPVLLIRDYGPWAWVVFAVPNVVGAAAMGWTIPSASHSVTMVQKHRGMMVAFSFITACFQIFFAMWIFSRLGDRRNNFAAATVGLALFGVLLPTTGVQRAARWLAILSLLVSGCCIMKSTKAGRWKFQL